MYNRLLERQIKKFLGEEVREEFAAFFKAVSESYDHYEMDRKMLERSIELTSRELMDLNSKLKKETEDNSREVYGKLRESLEMLKDEELSTLSNEADLQKLQHIADILKEETQKRRQVEKDMRRRDIQLLESQRIAHIGSWEVELDGYDLADKPYYWSDETYRIFGLEPASITITNELFISMVHPDDRDLMMNKFMDAVKNHQSYEVIHRIVLQDGIEKILHERAVVLYNKATGKPDKVIGTAQDITERRKAEIELQKAHTELRLLFENMREVYYVVDMQTYQLLQISRACEEVYGRGIGEFMQNSNLWFEVILEEDRGVIEANYPVMHAGKPFTQQYRIRHTDGKVRWLESKMTPILDESHQLIRLYGISADITERKEAEIALKASEHKFRSLIENTSDLITVADKDLNLIYVSDSSLRITGFTPEEVLGKRSFGFAHPDDDIRVQKLLKEVLAEPGVTKSIVYRTTKKDGSYIWCERVITNLLHDPAVYGIVSNMRDVTERIEYEQTLQAANENLKKINMELDKFVYSVSHDLRAPLASVLGLTEYSLIIAPEGEVSANLQLIQRSVNKLDGFIQDILDYSRNSRVEIKSEKINLYELVDEVVKNLKFMSKTDKEIDIRLNLENDFYIYSDRSRLSIILNNLISNAIRYHNSKSEKAFVEIASEIKDNNTEIRIADNGIGIAPEHHDKIFDMFFRVSKKSVGSGLGLYIVKETVEKLNGAITIDSEINKGTTFTISIPNNKQIKQNEHG